MSDRAVIEAELQGAGKVAADAKKVKSALADAKKEGEGAKRGAAGASGEVMGLGQRVDALRSSLNPQAILGGVLGGALVQGLSSLAGYLGTASDKAKDFGESTSASARRAGLNVNQYRGTLEANERATLQTAEAQDTLVQEVHKLNYGSRGAMASLEGLGKIATASGRNVQEYAPLVASLQDGLGVVGDVTGEVERLIAEAQRLNVIGGPQAFLDTIAALRPALGDINNAVDESGRKFIAFAAQLQTRLRPEQARTVAAGAESMIKGRLLDVERVLGRQVMGADGKISDPVRILKELRDRAFKMNGGNKAYARAGLIKAFGTDLGQQIYSTDFDAVEKDARIKDRASAGPAYDKYIAKPEGQRALRDTKERQRDRSRGGTALTFMDELGEMKEAAIDALRPIRGMTDSEALSAVKNVGANALGSVMGGGSAALGWLQDRVGKFGFSASEDENPAGTQGGRAGAKPDYDAFGAAVGKAVAAELSKKPITAKLPLQVDPNAPKGN